MGIAQGENQYPCFREFRKLVDIQKLRTRVRGVAGVTDSDDMRVWGLTSGQTDDEYRDITARNAQSVLSEVTRLARIVGFNGLRLLNSHGAFYDANSSTRSIERNPTNSIAVTQGRSGNACASTSNSSVTR